MTTLRGLILSSEYGSLINGIRASYAKVFDDTTKVIEPMYKKVFDYRKIDNAAMVKYGKISGDSALENVAEGAAIATGKKFLGDDTVVRFAKFGKVTSVTRESIVDGTYMNNERHLKHAAISARRALDVGSFGVLNTAFTNASSYVVGNTSYPIYRPSSNEPLLSSSHALANGGTDSNVLAGSDALSPASLSKLKRLARETRLENGEPMSFMGGFRLLVPPALEDLALRIVGSDKIRGSANNDVNTHKDVEVVVVPMLAAAFGGSDTAYFLIAKGENGLFTAVREEPSMVTEINNHTRTIDFIVSTRFSAGFEDWRGVFGSRGDGVAYAG